MTFIIMGFCEDCFKFAYVTSSTSPRSERDLNQRSSAREAGALPRRLNTQQLLLAYDS